MRERMAATAVNDKSLTRRVFFAVSELRRVCRGTKNRPDRAGPGGAKKAVKEAARAYEARAARRCGTTGTTAFTGLATLARAVARARFRALTMKQRSSAR